MKRLLLSVLSVLAVLWPTITSCVHKPVVRPVSGNFPQEIGEILVNKCATAGCHNEASYVNADNLLLDTWEHLFDGGNSGAAVIPYSPVYSPLLYFVNVDSSLGTVATPTMPYSTGGAHRDPLSKDEYMKLKTWITNGAPDKDGNIAFSSNPDTRQKIYVTQQGCDLLAVIDAEKKVVMRYIPIGMNAAGIESPHCVRTSSDGKYAYVSFLNGNYLQKIDTRTDQVVGSANLGLVKQGGAWNILYIAPADTAILTSDWQGFGGLAAMVSTANMTVKTNKTLTTLVYPHGITSNLAFDTFFITSQYGNVVYKISYNGPYIGEISLNGLPAVESTDSTGIGPNPHEIMMSPDQSRYFVTCQGTNDVRVMNAHTDSLIATIPVGRQPQEMAISTTQPYMFVTCMEDDNTLSSHNKGTVYVINYNTLAVVQVLNGDFYQPHGITVDDKLGLVYIISTNANPSGPAPHHATACNGRAGWYTVYDLHTLQPWNNYRYQVTVMPYSAAARFK